MLLPILDIVKITNREPELCPVPHRYSLEGLWLAPDQVFVRHLTEKPPGF